MLDERSTILTRILAAGDAVWQPCREWENPRLPANLYFGRLDYRTVGVRWASDADSEGGRKSVQRQLEAHAIDGLVTVHRPRGVKVLAVKLSDAADWHTRAACGLPSTVAAHASMIELERLGGRTGRWVATEALMNTEAPDRPAGWSRGQEAALILDMMLPALVRGWVEANSIYNGHVYFRLTPTGLAWLDANPDEPADVDGDGDAELQQLYFSERQAARHHLETAQPRVPGELGMMPLYVSLENAVHPQLQVTEKEQRYA